MAFPTKREKAFRARLKEAEAVLDIVRRFGCESAVAISPAVQPMLAALPHDWDGEGAPPPTAETLEQAGRAVVWAREKELQLIEVDADVLGGVAVWLGSPRHPQRRAWFAFRNDGTKSVVLSNGTGLVDQAPLSDDSRARAVSFLTAERINVEARQESEPGETMIPIEKLKQVRVIITHANCPDGIASAILLHDALPEAGIRFLTHRTKEYRELPAHAGMLFCDIAPPSERVELFRALGAIVLDHHKSAEALVKRFRVPRLRR